MCDTPMINAQDVQLYDLNAYLIGEKKEYKCFNCLTF